MTKRSRQSKTVDVRLMLPRAEAERWLRSKAIPFTHVREQTSRGPTDVRIRRAYYLDFAHQYAASFGRRNPDDSPAWFVSVNGASSGWLTAPTKAAALEAARKMFGHLGTVRVRPVAKRRVSSLSPIARLNPRGLSAAEERQYKAIARAGRKRYGARAKEVAARTVLAQRNPPAHKARYGELEHLRKSFPGRRGWLVSKRVRDLRYHHAQSSQGTPFLHRFGRGVEAYALEDGSLLLRGARGQRLWSTFMVRDET